MSDTPTGNPKIHVDDTKRFARVIEISDTHLGDSEPPSFAGHVFETEGNLAKAHIIEIDRLWEATPGTSSRIVDALELLRQASDNLEQARKCDNPVDADQFVQRAQLTLPKLFTYRSIGEGFGIVINSLHFAFYNLHGTPLTASQLNVVWRALRELRVRPAMSFEQGINHAEELEKQGLEINPPELAELLESVETRDKDDE